MSPRLKALEAAALTLPTAERAALAEALISSLDTNDEVELEQLWVRESERRYTAFQAGKIAARPAADAIRDARARLQ